MRHTGRRKNRQAHGRPSLWQRDLKGVRGYEKRICILASRISFSTGPVLVSRVILIVLPSDSAHDTRIIRLLFAQYHSTRRTARVPAAEFRLQRCARQTRGPRETVRDRPGARKLLSTFQHQSYTKQNSQSAPCQHLHSCFIHITGLALDPTASRQHRSPDWLPPIHTATPQPHRVVALTSAA